MLALKVSLVHLQQQIGDQSSKYPALDGISLRPERNFPDLQVLLSHLKNSSMPQRAL